jgi:hypothetical protein
MKARKTHYHTVGQFTFSGETKTAARQAFDAALASYCEESQSFHVENRYGSIFIIWRDLHGWNVRNIWGDCADPAFVHGSSHTMASCSSCASHESMRDVVQSARMHCAQNHWTYETEDESHVAAAGLATTGESELRRWIRFQREYRRLKAAGHNDSECHEMACRAA